MQLNLKENEFKKFAKLVHELTGIHLGPMKLTLVESRLYKRLRHYGFNSYGEYYDFILKPGQEVELEMVVDIITTNETHFFREPAHYDFIQNEILSRWPSNSIFRAWSAASSTGQEAYSLSMCLDDHPLVSYYDILGSDINQTVIRAARRGVYPIALADEIPKNYLKKYCLKGVRSMEGTFKVHERIKNPVKFERNNLRDQYLKLNHFHLIFLRNVLIYFENDVRTEIIQKISHNLIQGGYLIIGHSESLSRIDHKMEAIRPSIYRKK